MEAKKFIEHKGINRVISHKGIDGSEVDTYKKGRSKANALAKKKK